VSQNAIEELMQEKQAAWHWQWERLQDDSRQLFEEWILPHTLDVFRDLTVVDAGCGGGQHTSFIAHLARRVYAVDLNTVELARERNRAFTNVCFVEGDLATVRLPEPADALFCIGVIHHTVDPTLTFAHLKTLVRPGGLMIVWCYSREGNSLNRWLVEPTKKLLLRRCPRSALLVLAWALTLLLHPLVHTIYRLPLPFLPYYRYFSNWRRLSLTRNMLNVFDKLNAPLTHFIPREMVERWFSADAFDGVHIDDYVGVSWRASGRLRHA
jgi:SAM-dependent methyltransferase